MTSNDRRDFLRAAATGAAGLGLVAMGVAPSGCASTGNTPTLPFRISLAQWSLHRTLGSGKLDALEFPTETRKEFGIDAVEYVNSFFKDKARDHDYLGELRKRAADSGVRSLLIMVDGEGRLGDPDAGEEEPGDHQACFSAALLEASSHDEVWSATSCNEILLAQRDYGLWLDGLFPNAVEWKPEQVYRDPFALAKEEPEIGQRAAMAAGSR